MSKLTQNEISSIAKMMGYIDSTHPSDGDTRRWLRFANTNSAAKQTINVPLSESSNWDVCVRWYPEDKKVGITWDLAFICPYPPDSLIHRSCILFLHRIEPDRDRLIELLSNINDIIEDGKAAAEFVTNGPYEWTCRDEDMEHLNNYYE